MTFVPARSNRFVRALVGFVAAMVVFGALPVVSTSAASSDPVIRHIRLPIPDTALDTVHWSDTWGAPRSSGRTHEGVDIMGPRLTPLVAVADARVTYSRFDNSRGSMIFLSDADGWRYAYIHLNNDNRGTDDGQAPCNRAFSQRLCDLIPNGSNEIPRGTRVRAGEVIGYMGDSGNAEHTAPHLHFEIIQPDGNAVNPTASVDAAAQRVRSGGSSGSPVERPQTNRFSVSPDDPKFVEHVFRRTHGRTPTSAERAAFTQRDAGGDFWAAVAVAANGDAPVASIDRLYASFFQRVPDDSGLDYWMNQAGKGQSLEIIAELFANSEEYQIRYGGKDFSTFLDLLYRDVLGRNPDQKGKRYWLDQLRSGRVTIGTIVVYFSESSEMKTVTLHRNELMAVKRLLGESRPSRQELEEWRQLRQGNDLATALKIWVSVS